MKRPATTIRQKRGSSAEREAERERLEKLIQANEERLAENRAANGKSLTLEQQQTLRGIIQLQREKLEQING